VAHFAHAARYDAPRDARCKKKYRTYLIFFLTTISNHPILIFFFIVLLTIQASYQALSSQDFCCNRRVSKDLERMVA
jgi:hypothetical protein